MEDASAMAADEINKQGGVLGRPIQIDYQDTRGMAAEGTAAAERLVVQDKVVAIFGEFHSSVALAEMEVVHKYNVPFLACDVWSPQVTAKGYPQVFRNSTTYPLLDEMIAGWLVAVGFKRAALLCEQDDIGLEWRQGVADILKKNNLPFELYTAIRRHRLHGAASAAEGRAAAVRSLPGSLWRGRSLSDDAGVALARLRADCQDRAFCFGWRSR